MLFQDWGCSSVGGMPASHAQSSGFQPQHRIKPTVIAHACTSSTLEETAGRPEVPGDPVRTQPGLQDTMSPTDGDDDDGNNAFPFLTLKKIQVFLGSPVRNRRSNWSTLERDILWLIFLLLKRIITLDSQTAFPQTQPCLRALNLSV